MNWFQFPAALILIGFSCFLPAGLQAQGELKWKNSVESQGSFQVGDTVSLVFKCEIPDGYHTYSSKPTEKDGPLITTLTFTKTKGLKLVGGLAEKDGDLHTAYDDIFETEVYEYHGRVTFYQKAVVTQKCFEAEGLLEYGVCNDMGCMPGSNEFGFKEKVKK
ncbi:MAG: hypothetical protein H6581_06865 [Bacteroidia bacterium]|nr:hypothetical protein [Bacteroidia bacterium]